MQKKFKFGLELTEISRVRKTNRKIVFRISNWTLEIAAIFYKCLEDFGFSAFFLLQDNRRWLVVSLVG